MAFYAKLCIVHISQSQNVCPFVFLLQFDIASKRLDISSTFFHHVVSDDLG